MTGDVKDEGTDAEVSELVGDFYAARPRKQAGKYGYPVRMTKRVSQVWR